VDKVTRNLLKKEGLKGFALLDRHPETAAVHAGRLAIPLNAASSPPLFQASSYEFEDLEEVEAIYAGTRAGAVYGRYGGPNGAQFEGALAELEGAEAAVGSAAGMSAIHAVLGVTLSRGGPLLATRELYGGTFVLLENDYQNSENRVEYVNQQDLSAVATALERLKPAVFYAEALTNPLLHVADLPALAALAHEAGALLVVDATFATPALCRPLEHGADLVVHSVGKYLGGHGDVGAGAVAGSRELIDEVRGRLVRTGASMPHFEAWLALRGLRTLALRMERHSSNALAVAAFLAHHPRVAAVHHPSLTSGAERARIEKLYPRGTGGMLAFDLAPGPAAVAPFLRGLETIAIVHSLGEVATTISYPAVSSHRPLAAQARRALGVGDATLRISTGIEHPSDIIADLERALAGLA
jgi:cystathionine beta-lyase/cystathionine gamma-synthase